MVDPRKEDVVERRGSPAGDMVASPAVVGMVEAVPYDEQFLDASWRWLQDPEIRRLTMTPEFTRNQQGEWFADLRNRTDYVIWGVSLGGNPIGAFGLKAIADGKGEYWGYLGEKTYWGQGIGNWMVNEAIRQAHRLGLVVLELKVLKSNVRAIRLYEKHRFRRRDDIKESDQLVWMELRLR